MDTMKVTTGVYQYRAVDDCSRFRVLGVYPRRTAKHTVDFLDRVIEEMPFQTARGVNVLLRKCSVGVGIVTVRSNGARHFRRNGATLG